MGEITIEIPKSNAAKSAEDQLVMFVLNELQDMKSVQIMQRTSGYNAGNWVPSIGPDTRWRNTSFEEVEKVIRAFKKKGYVI